jgi:hypothetical protein
MTYPSVPSIKKEKRKSKIDEEPIEKSIEENPKNLWLQRCRRCNNICKPILHVFLDLYEGGRAVGRDLHLPHIGMESHMRRREQNIAKDNPPARHAK